MRADHEDGDDRYSSPVALVVRAVHPIDPPAVRCPVIDVRVPNLGLLQTGELLVLVGVQPRMTRIEFESSERLANLPQPALVRPRTSFELAQGGRRVGGE